MSVLPFTTIAGWDFKCSLFFFRYQNEAWSVCSVLDHGAMDAIQPKSQPEPRLTEDWEQNSVPFNYHYDVTTDVIVLMNARNFWRNSDLDFVSKLSLLVSDILKFLSF